MKSFLKIAGLTSALVIATPLFAQAAPYTNNDRDRGHDQGRTVQTVTVTKTQVRVAPDYSGYRAQRGHIMPLANVVNTLENRTGATVTDIQLAKNGKAYNFEGVTERGFIVKATADAYTGKVSNVQSTKYRPKYDPKAIPITRLLTKLRQQGFRDFDFVSLKDQQGVYVVRGLNRIGQPVQILANAKTGNIYGKKATNQYYGPSYARSEYRDFDSLRPALEKNKYSHFDNVVAYDDYYTANARDDKGRTVQLIINAFTGALLSK
ncbi:MAG: PepSY domain-containing protein [Parvibaculaceae bacterium]